ncbi:MAG TPA: hypothetical protein VGG95_14860 [Edaphobacter sp.]
MKRAFAKFLYVTLLSWAFSSALPAWALPSGTILVIDSTAGTNAQGALFAVNPTSGQRVVLSDFGLSTQGPQGVDPESVCWVPATLLGPKPMILVTDGSAGTNGWGALFGVDPDSGQRTLLTDFGDTAQGAVGLYPLSVTVAPAGLLGLGSTILVLDAYAGTNGQGALFMVNPSNGQRTLLSDFGLSSQGPAGAYPDNVMLLSGGLLGLGTSLVVSDGSAGTSGLGAIFTIDPNTGKRTLISDFGNSDQGPVDPDLNSFPNSVAVLPGGLLGLNPSLLVTDSYSGTQEKGTLFKVDPGTGLRTIVSDFGDQSGGPTGVDVDGVVVANSRILVLDGGAGTDGLGALFTVDPQSGHRTVLSDFGSSTQGTLGSYPTGMVVLP